MCGISGIVSVNCIANKREMRQRVECMNAAVAHRGPDANNILLLEKAAFGHTRLDLNGGSSGRQPMFDRESGIAMVYNGELYGHTKAFAAGISDSRIFLEGYLKQGLAYLAQTDAEYAAAFYNQSLGETILVRDRFGTKPLYYAFTQSQFIFSSEAKGVLAAGLLRSKLNVEHLLDSMLRIDTNSSTPFTGINVVPPGNALVVRADLSSYLIQFDHLKDKFVNSASTSNDNASTALENLQTLFVEAVSKRFVADHQVGIFLSGGLDSSLIAASAVTLGYDPKSFTIAFTDPHYDESVWATQVAKHLGITNEQTLVTDAQRTTFFSDAIYHAEHFVQQTDGVAKLLLAQKANKSVKAVLVGEGADEVFLGYPSHIIAATKPEQNILATVTNQTTRIGLDFASGVGVDTKFWVANLGFVPNQVKQTQMMLNTAQNILHKSMVKRLQPNSRLEAFMQESGARLALSSVAKEQLADMILTMPNYLFSYLGGKIEMANALEGRYPFLDRNLVDYAITLKPHVLLDSEQEKGLLRQLGANMLPQNILRRPKHGFSAGILPETMRIAVLNGDFPGMTRKEIGTLGVFDFDQLADLFHALGAVGRFADEQRVACERLAVFAVSVQTLQTQFFDPKHRQFRVFSP